jgi:protoheme ferro-lyase
LDAFRRYWKPFTEEAILQIKKDRIQKLVVLPLYPQFSISTSGSSLRLLEELFKADDYLYSMPHTVIPSWYQVTIFTICHTLSSPVGTRLKTPQSSSKRTTR